MSKAPTRKPVAPPTRKPVAPPAPTPAAVPVELGGLPPAALLAGAGLLLISISMSLLRVTTAVPELATNLMFWVGLLLVVVPGALRLLSRQASRLERIGLLLLIAEGLYLVKVVRDPIAFTRHDELLHWRTAFDIISSGRLFESNPLLVVST
ncbi:MAG: hypothetical protein ABI622_06570, partial [Chloroflexota bacterium]